MMVPSSALLRYLLAGGFLLAIIVVILGAYTRLSDAGLGCPDWPGCYGFLTVPETETDIAVAEQRFPESPVEVEKGWPEMIHRYFAGTLGLLIFTTAVIVFRQRGMRQDGFGLSGLAFGLVGLVIFQALLGMWTVTLKLWPQVVALHLLGGFATLSLMFLLLLRVWTTPWRLNPDRLRRVRRLAPVAVLGILLLIGQIFLGGWTSANYAALACPDLPTCQTQWWPPMNFSSGFNLAQDIGPNYLGGVLDNPSRVAIHMSHRIGALVVFVFLSGFLVQSLRLGAGTPLPGLAAMLGGLLVLQGSLGISNVLFQIPLPVAVLHNACGAALLLSLILITYRLLTSIPEES